MLGVILSFFGWEPMFVIASRVLRADQLVRDARVIIGDLVLKLRLVLRRTPEEWDHESCSQDRQ